jgi:hypothetical protein
MVRYAQEFAGCIIAINTVAFCAVKSCGFECKGTVWGWGAPDSASEFCNNLPRYCPALSIMFCFRHIMHTEISDVTTGVSIGVLVRNLPALGQAEIRPDCSKGPSWYTSQGYLDSCLRASVLGHTARVWNCVAAAK